MDLRITHETVYDYTPAVETAQHVAYLQPLNTSCQTLLSHQLDVFPTPALLTQTTDLYGNQRTFFSLQSPHTQLRVVATSEVRTRAPQEADSTMSWETLREGFRYHTDAAWNLATEFSFASVHAPRHEEFTAYARPSFGPGVAALAAARDLMARIHADFTYESQSTEIDTPALEALAQRKGVCQDFAHIMIACLRGIGMPAGYVSGFLRTIPPKGKQRLAGADAMHAWVRVWCGQHDGWIEFDPTNAMLAGPDHITIGHGRDYTDISPIVGVLRTSHGGHDTKQSVDVIRVE